MTVVAQSMAKSNSIPLKTLFTSHKGKKPEVLTDTQIKDSVPYIDIKAFEKDEFRRFADKKTSQLVTEGELLIVWDGARSGLIGRTPINGALGSTLAVLRPRKNMDIISDYALYFLRGQFHKINSNTRGTGIPHVDPEVLWKLELPQISPSEQQEVVNKLNEVLPRVRTARERAQRARDNLRRFLQSILQSAFRGELTEGWRKDNENQSADIFLEEMLRLRESEWPKGKKYKNPKEVICTPFGDIPSQWESVKSDALFSFVTSGSRGWAKYYSEEGALFIRIGNLSHETIHLDFKKNQHVSPPSGIEGSRTQIELNDLLISITADVGMVSHVSENMGEAYVNQHVAIARPVSVLNSKYLAYYFLSPEGQKQLVGLQKGAIKAGLRLDDIKDISVPLPSLEEQKEIVKRVELYFEIADGVDKRLQNIIEDCELTTSSVLLSAFKTNE